MLMSNDTISDNEVTLHDETKENDDVNFPNENDDYVMENNGNGHTLSHLVFDGKNFPIWKRRIEQAVKAKGWINTLKSKKGDTEGERDKTLDSIMSHINDNVLRLVRAETPFDLLAELQKRYAIADSAAIVTTRSKLANHRLSDFKTANEYVDEMLNLMQSLRDMNHDVTTEEEVSWLLAGLPETYKHVKTSVIMALHTSQNVDISLCRTLILSEAAAHKKERRKTGTPNSAFAASTKTCYRCNKPGHISKDCRSVMQPTNRRNDNVTCSFISK